MALIQSDACIYAMPRRQSTHAG